MNVEFILNGQKFDINCAPYESLMDVLRRSRLWSVKHGCETGDCGACSVLLDGNLVPTCVLLAGQVKSRSIVTVEGLTGRHDVHPIQQAFIDTGAIQCGYCTPAMILSTKALLDKESFPSEHQAREALSGVLCRCTGYVKPLQAIMQAAASLRGEDIPTKDDSSIALDDFIDNLDKDRSDPPATESNVITQSRVEITPTLTTATTNVIGHPEPKVDALRLAKGRPVFTDDIDFPDILHAALLTSPHAHARILGIDASLARKLPGVHAVLTYEDIPRVIYASGGQTYPNPPPWDQVSLDSKVRHVGDRVAIVAAETPYIAREALRLIEVDYAPLPAVFEPQDATVPGAPVIHDEPDAISIADSERNLAAEIHASVGDVEKALSESDYIISSKVTSSRTWS